MVSAKKVSVVEWPPQSPDLNPIENLWEIVNQTKNCTNSEILFKRLEDAWNAIPTNFISNLIASMPRRCQAVIEKKGFATKY